MFLDPRNAIRAIAAAAVVVNVATGVPYPDVDININDFRSSDIISRDICIIGGGSSGTYAAIRLRELGKSVVVVEKADRLGGHTNTYIDPATGIPVDYGVVVFHDLPLVRSYFAHFNVSLAPAAFNTPGIITQYVDFDTGKMVAGYSPADPTPALGAYAAQLAKYPYLAGGFYLPDPVPADLLLPFGDFVKKYSLDAMVQTVFMLSQGVGNLLKMPTVYVMMVISLDLIRNLETGFISTAEHDNSAIYDRALVELGSDALISSKVIAMDRDSGPHSLVLVQTPSGQKLIQASKVIIAIPPKLDNLRGFGLDDTERDLFAQFNNAAYYTSLLRETSIPDNLQITNIGPSTPYNLPPLPGIYSLYQTGIPGLIDVKYGSSTVLRDEEVQRNIINDILRLKHDNLSTTAGEFAAFQNHSPFQLTVPAEAIQDGFYKKLYALQGHRNTFYTGAAWTAHDSSLIWTFTEALLANITA